MCKVDTLIAKCLVKAQTASDGGKHIDTIYGRDNHNKKAVSHMGYGLKTAMILRAIKLISNSRSSFTYYVITADDQNGYPSIITYFQWYLPADVVYNGKKQIQISFHTPLNMANDLMPYVGKGFKVEWDRKSSADTAQMLAEVYNI